MCGQLYDGLFRSSKNVQYVQQRNLTRAGHARELFAGANPVHSFHDAMPADPFPETSHEVRGCAAERKYQQWPLQDLTPHRGEVQQVEGSH